MMSTVNFDATNTFDFNADLKNRLEILKQNPRYYAQAMFIAGEFEIKDHSKVKEKREVVRKKKSKNKGRDL